MSANGVLKKKTFDVVRPLADGKTYVMLGVNLSGAGAAEVHWFHKKIDHKYVGGAYIRDHRPLKSTCTQRVQVQHLLGFVAPLGGAK